MDKCEDFDIIDAKEAENKVIFVARKRIFSYAEAKVLEANANDHVDVGWQMPPAPFPHHHKSTEVSVGETGCACGDTCSQVVSFFFFSLG